MKTLIVRTKEKEYPICLGHGLLSHAGELIRDKYRGKRIMIVSDDRVYPVWGERLKIQLNEDYICESHVIPHGEASKNIQMLPELYRAFLRAHIDRSDLIIALGGGVVGDLTGFAAATYLRGVKLIQIPTSLLAQVDSSVGGKTAVDLPEGKNLVGAFYQPEMVLIDPDILDTLPDRFMRDGMGEVIKYACIEDKELYRILFEADGYSQLKKRILDVIYRCVDCKRRIVEEDERDLGKRMLLNFGHTLAHAIEQYYNYGRESHGEAVAVGMYQITKLAEQKGLTEPGCAAKISNLLDAYGLPCECGIESDALLDVIDRDKKNLNGSLNLVLLHQIGESYIYPAEKEFLKAENAKF